MQSAKLRVDESMSQVALRHLLPSHTFPPFLYSLRSFATSYTARVVRADSSGRQIIVELDPSNLSLDSHGYPIPRRDLICHICNLLRTPPSPSTDPLLDVADYLQTLTLTLTPSEVSEILKSLRPLRKALEFFRFVKTLPGYRHDCFAYNRILAILARSSADQDIIGGIVDEMEKEGVKGNISTVNILIGAMGGTEYDRCLELAKQWGLRFNGYTYKCLMQAYLRHRDVERAFRVYEEMGKRGHKLDIFAYNMLLDALAKADKTYPNPLQDNPAYSVVKQYFVNIDDTVAQKIVVHKDSPRGTHFRRAGPRQRVYFESDEVHACIVTCGGLCPGLNTVIREIVCGLAHMYGVSKILGIEGGYKGFYARNTLSLTPKIVNDIHKRGGTILGTSRGGHDTSKIVDSIEDRGINQVYIIGGDGTQKGASVIFEEIKRRGLKVSVVGIPKTIDNDIAVIDKSFGFDTAVEEAQRAINAAHVEAESIEHGIGVVKLMGRYSGFIAMYATLASRDVDCCLIPESPFYLEGNGGLFEFTEKRLKENGHMVLVVAEGAGQELIAESMRSMDYEDASGNKLLQDIGLWLSQKIKHHFSSKKKMSINLKYIDPTYMIRAVPSNASDNVYCTLLAQSAVHGAMAGYTGFTVAPVNGRHSYIPFYRITETQNKVVITDRMWARLLSSTNQPSFLSQKAIEDAKNEDEPPTQLLDGEDSPNKSNEELPSSPNQLNFLSHNGTEDFLNHNGTVDANKEDEIQTLPGAHIYCKPQLCDNGVANKTSG